jgi:ferredoxin-NADP reductase
LETRATTYTAALLKRRWLSKKTFEITLSLPPAFEFKPGQRISLSIDQHERDYSIVSAPGESELTLCIRNVSGGKLSNLLSAADIGASFSVKGPVGYFTYKSSACPAVFVATGTGIAPFSSMARSGISGYTLLHGASLPEDLYREPKSCLLIFFRERSPSISRKSLNPKHMIFTFAAGPKWSGM